MKFIIQSVLESSVKVDGEEVSCEPFEELSLARRYFLF